MFNIEGSCLQSSKAAWNQPLMGSGCSDIGISLLIRGDAREGVVRGNIRPLLIISGFKVFATLDVITTDEKLDSVLSMLQII